MPDIWQELETKVNYVRELYVKLHIPLKPGEGLEQAILEAESLARGIKSPSAPAESSLMASVEAFHVIWALCDSIKSCVDTGLDVSNHLKQITTGTTDYGKPASSDPRVIFFKDFECELFVAGTLAKAGLPVCFLEDPNDPRGEMRVEDVFVEVKHPNSLGQLRKLVRKFNGKLQPEGLGGVFIVGLEDAFNLADQSQFLDHADFSGWQKKKRSQMEEFGKQLMPLAAALPQIAATAQISTQIEIVGGATTMRRNGNSLIFDNKTFGQPTDRVVRRIAQVFNSNPPLYSRI